MKIQGLKIKDLNIKIPVIQGGMGIGVSGWRLASAVANAGGVGIISGAGCGYREDDYATNTVEANVRGFRNEIRKAKSNTKGVIGVNIMVAMQNYADYVKVAIEEKVDLIISGAGLPLDLPELAKGSSTKIVPIVSSLRAAKLIMKRWKKKFDARPDAIVVEGARAGGHLGFKKEELLEGTFMPLMDIVTELKDFLKEENLKIPVVAAGGIFTGEDVKVALENGADGVQMATRFVATYECDASDEFKQAYIEAKKEDIVIMDSPVGMPGRAILNPMLKTVESGQRVQVRKCYKCVHKCDPKTTPFCITQALINAVQGDLDNSLLFVGENAYKVDKLQHVEEVFDEIKLALGLVDFSHAS